MCLLCWAGVHILLSSNIQQSSYIQMSCRVMQILSMNLSTRRTTDPPTTNMPFTFLTCTATVILSDPFASQLRPHFPCLPVIYPLKMDLAARRVADQKFRSCHNFFLQNRYKYKFWTCYINMYAFLRAWYSRVFLKRPPLLTLPPEILFDICLRLDCHGLLAATQVQTSI